MFLVCSYEIDEYEKLLIGLFSHLINFMVG